MALYNMKEILADAQKRGYGVGFFNAVNLEMIRAYIEAAEELDSPIIIGTAEALLPIAPFEWIVPAMLEAARRAKAPVAVQSGPHLSFQDADAGAARGLWLHHVRRFAREP